MHHDAYGVLVTASDRLIVALDFSQPGAALDLVERIGDQVGSYKVGLELLTAAGRRSSPS